MNILITGATGFIGKNLVHYLQKENELFFLVRPTTDRKLLKEENTIEFTDDIIFLSQYLKKNRIEGIVHLASLYVKEHTTKQVKDIILSNIYLGTALLEACKLSDVKWFLNTGSIWQNYNVDDFSEEYCPVNLYAASKQAFITMAKYYTETSSIRFCTLKLCDTFGNNDTRKKIFALFDSIVATGETLDMTKGEQLMDILNIEDVVKGFYQLIQQLHQGKNSRQEYVLTSGHQIKLKDLAKIYEIRNNVKLNINWGKRSYNSREVMRPYVGVKLEGWQPENLSHLGILTGGGDYQSIKCYATSLYYKEVA